MTEHVKHLADSPQIETMISKAAHGASYIGGSATVASGLTLNEWGVVVGMCFTGLTYFTFLYFKIRQDRREERAIQKD